MKATDLVWLLVLASCDMDMEQAARSLEVEDAAPLAPPPAAATGRYRVLRRGSAVSAAGALFLGSVERAVLWQPLHPREPIELRCHLSWQLSAIAVVSSTNACPSCIFGFELTAADPTDLLAQAGMGTSNCPNVTVPPSFEGFVSPTYGAVMWQDATSPLSVYTYDYTYGPPSGFTTPNLTWNNDGPWRYVY